MDEWDALQAQIDGEKAAQADRKPTAAELKKAANAPLHLHLNKVTF